jgi:3-hydroxyacyl-CoA dehydrogenase/enoyl-CoA hydratase/3-hydroxybutyryl-CoA epimerase
LGFPPFLGGPFRYVDAKGAKAIVGKMTQLEKEIGDRFKPAELLVKQAGNGKKFY